MERFTESVFVVEVKLNLCFLSHYEQIVWENSDIKWLKVPWLLQLWPNTSPFNFLGTFCEQLKLIADGFLATCQPT